MKVSRVQTVKIHLDSMIYQHSKLLHRTLRIDILVYTLYQGTVLVHALVGTNCSNAVLNGLHVGRRGVRDQRKVSVPRHHTLSALLWAMRAWKFVRGSTAKRSGTT